METQIIKKGLKDFKGDAWLVKLHDNYYVVSGVNAMFSGWEVLVFKSDKDENIKNWGEVAGGRGMTHEEAIEDLEERETEILSSPDHD